MLPLEPGTAGPMLQSLGAALPRPRAIVAMSPHWMARRLRVGAHPRPATVHDFAGFDPALGALRYAAPGDPELAGEVADLLRKHGWDADVDPSRGLDHGIWVPLSLSHPQADIPVVPLAMPWPLAPSLAWELGHALRPLSEQDVLVLGTGSATHNLHDFHPAARTDDAPDPYVVAFVEWLDDALHAGDLAALFDYRRRAPHAARAHPTDEHLMPLFFALGAGGGPAHRHHGGVHYGMLSMDAWTFGAASPDLRRPG